MSTPTMTLSPASGTFPFQEKTIPMPSGTKVILGSTEVSTGLPARVPSASNGWFPPKQTEDSAIASVSPLPLSSSHAEIWCDGGKHVLTFLALPLMQVYIRDLDSAFGTYVNAMRISKTTILKAGDTICLGSRIARNGKTPAYITDFHLSPVVAKVSLSGVSS
ncbi:hypothetical protein GALMADRAFT_142954 [Galerina marginata CBS 339.88]|uniref:FHA domain-containing protein n=1 Tax=Galerina marginata (strain CBS 339.88) TaxID=685588 RepID=A0A067SRI5_GALM3|nr:hypothetical protein GALMADRAFT_142954 [Galerina marginata CBS 339.88]